jgi:hypothetical protein
MPNNVWTRLVPLITASNSRTLHRPELAAKLGLKEDQVRHAMQHAIRNDRLPGLVVVSRGSAWRYVPQDAPRVPVQARLTPATQDVEQMYIRVGVTGNGKVIVRPEGDTALFVLQPLEA